MRLRALCRVRDPLCTAHERREGRDRAPAGRAAAPVPPLQGEYRRHQHQVPRHPPSDPPLRGRGRRGGPRGPEGHRARGQRVRLRGRDRQRGPGHHSHREEPGLLPGEHHTLVHCRRRLAGLCCPLRHLLVLRKRPGQRHRGDAGHRGPGAPQHIAQRGSARRHGGRERGELLCRGAAV